MKLVVGLGNPGRKYEGTRHNVGFQVLKVLAQRHGIDRRRVRFEGELAESTLGGEPVMLVAPQTFMNASGRCVRQVVDFFQVSPDSLLVVCDDFNLPLDRIRIRAKGSAGGQKGLKDIVGQLGTEQVPRLRIGIGEPDRSGAVDYVLARFSRAEQRRVEGMIDLAADAVEVWVREGIESCMNRFN